MLQRLLKRPFIMAALLLVVVIGAGYLVVPVGEPRISQANCDRIQLGWSQAQVREVLGNCWGTVISYDDYYAKEWWDEDNALIRVAFNPHTGQVTNKRYTPSDLSLFERLKGRIERRIRALWPKDQPCYVY